LTSIDRMQNGVNVQVFVGADDDGVDFRAIEQPLVIVGDEVGFDLFAHPFCMRSIEVNRC